MNVTVNKLSEAGAAEILGLDCSQPLDAETLSALKRTMLEYPVIAIRAQTLTPKQQATFSRQLGPLESQDRTTYTHPDDPDILILSNEIRSDGTAVGIVDAGDFSAFGLLASRRALQPHRALCRAQSAPGRRHRILQHVPSVRRAPAGPQAGGRGSPRHPSHQQDQDSRVTISAARTDAKDYYKQHEKMTKDVLQPMVRTHPETGRQALYISPRFTIGIADTAGFRSAAFARQALRRHDGRAISLPA